jgi:hypothetical protein
MVKENDLKLLAWGKNHMHDEGAVHCDEWEEFFNIHDELLNPENWKVSGKKKTINWTCLMA